MDAVEACRDSFALQMNASLAIATPLFGEGKDAQLFSQFLVVVRS
jgi:hypothetical protein